MSPRTVWSNFGESLPKEVPILEEVDEDPGISALQVELELGLDLTDMYRDIHDY